MMRRPLARTKALITESVGEELVIYDQHAERAHSLNPLAAKVWLLCDGEHTPEQIALAIESTEDEVEGALEELERCELFADAGLSRREGIRRLAQVGAGAFAAPLIYSVAIAPAMAAASTCSGNSDCAGRPNVASASCSSGQCVIDSCDTGFADCDGNFSNGCETNTMTSTSSCGSCVHACSEGQVCASGTCVTPP